MIQRFWRIATVVVLISLFGTAMRAQQTVSVPPALVEYPDLIIYNGKIVTMNDASLNNSSGRTVQKRMAVRGDRIQFIGSNQEILRYAGPQTRKIDLKGRTVTPGLIDTHNHLHNGAVSEWAKQNAAKIDAIAKSFSFSGKSYRRFHQGNRAGR